MSTPQKSPQATHASVTVKLSIALAALLVLLIAYVAAGPWIAMRGIQHAVETRDLSAMPKYINFEKLRPNIQAQMETIIAAQIANRGGMFGSAAAGAANVVAASAAEGMVSPAGIAVLLEGDALIKRAKGDMKPGSGIASGGPKSLNAFKNAQTHYLSASTFQATVEVSDAAVVDFIFEREGFRWKLANIKLPHKKAG